MVKGVWAARALFSPTIELPSTQAYSWAMKTAILGTLLLMVLTSTAQDSKRMFACLMWRPLWALPNLL
jgi:hypothetical protein